METILQENKSTNKKNPKKRKYVSSPTSSPSHDASTATPLSSIDPSLHQMKFIIEDFTDRKSQLAINAYDIIDQHIRVVDEEINLLETAIRLSGEEVPPVPTAKEVEELYSKTRKKRKRKKREKSHADDEDDENENSFEPVYCSCQKPNYGDMIRCDSDDCVIEWFHYPCVGLTKEPVKRWYCPDCTPHNK